MLQVVWKTYHSAVESLFVRYETSSGSTRTKVIHESIAVEITLRRQHQLLLDLQPGFHHIHRGHQETGTKRAGDTRCNLLIRP